MSTSPVEQETKIPKTQKGFIDVKALADYLSLSVRKVWQMRDAGELPAPIKFGKSVRWDFEALENWRIAGRPSCKITGRVPRNLR
jgi:excisionase family DNA binding protein